MDEKFRKLNETEAVEFTKQGMPGHEAGCMLAAMAEMGNTEWAKAKVAEMVRRREDGQQHSCNGDLGMVPCNIRVRCSLYNLKTE